MKSIFSAFVLALLASVALAADYPTNGYYRVNNKATSRYVYVCDNVGSINWSTTSAELGAVRLWKNPEKRFSDPASVLYFKVVDSNNHKYDLQAQGTGIYEIISHYVQLAATSNGFWFYAEQSGTARYLADERKSTTRDDGQMGTNNKGDYRIWLTHPISANTDEYFGIKPELQCDGKYYHPFYASFPFKFASSGMKAYYIKKIDVAAGVAYMAEYKQEIMAGGVPYIIECSSADPSNNRLDILTSGGTVPSDNQLKGNYFFNPDHYAAGDKAYKEFNASTMRILEVSRDKLQFVKSSTRLETYEDYPDKKFLPANQSYLLVPSNCPATLTISTEEVNAISEINADADAAEVVYSITGERVADGTTSLFDLPAGMYIVNGRKVQIR